MIVLHLLQLLVSATFFATTIGALCGSVLVVGCLKKKDKSTKLPTYVLERKDTKEKKDPKDKKDPTTSKEDIQKKPALPPPPKPAKPAAPPSTTPAKGAASPLDGPAKTPSTPNMSEKDSSKKPAKKQKGKKKGKLSWDSENIKPPSSMQSLKKKKPKQALGDKTVMRRDVPKSLESGEHDGMLFSNFSLSTNFKSSDLESAKVMEVPTDELLQSGKDRKGSKKGTATTGGESFVDAPPPSLQSKMGEFDKKFKSGEFVVKAVPDEITYSNVKYNTEQQSSIELVNESDVPAAIKIKSTDANIFRVIPVFRTIEPGGKSLVEVTRMPSAPKPDLLEIVAAPMTEGPLPDGGIPAIFKIVDVKDHKILKIPVLLV
uniref:Major sperm protein n=1 Tax=Meloidogyne hapla TaxID=6305 RepID=A0A1I8BBP4_MELHA